MKQKICMLGGSGFVGGHLTRRLVDEGYTVRVITRRPERHRELTVLPTVEMVACDINDVQALQAQFADCDVVINLIAVLNEQRAGDFTKLHVELPRRVAQACTAAGVSRLLHMSSLNADAKGGSSEYLRSKGEGEDSVHRVDGLHVTSFRPAVIFGPNDDFFNRFATLLSLSPLALPLACPDARFAPVYVGDVVDAFMKALEDRSTYGQRYDLCGPKVYTLSQLVEFTARAIGSGCAVVGLNDKLSRLQARIMEFVPGKPFTRDNYLSMKRDCVSDNNGLLLLGIEPTPMEGVVSNMLRPREVRARFDFFRRAARR
ncbi:MAG: complex I NDUFA9 subunit family protein [Gammaproteobacteria bacterium]|nr:complex I NDUFA9 subunit family protein [Gammaproteobacteria bacterium]